MLKTLKKGSETVEFLIEKDLIMTFHIKNNFLVEYNLFTKKDDALIWAKTKIN